MLFTKNMTSASTYYSTFTTRLIFILMSLEFTFISDYEKKNCPRTRWCLIIYRSIRRTDHVLQRDTVTCPRPAPVLRSYSTTQHTQLQHTAVLGIVLPGRPNILDSLHQKSFRYPSSFVSLISRDLTNYISSFFFYNFASSFITSTDC